MSYYSPNTIPSKCLCNDYKNYNCKAIVHVCLCSVWGTKYCLAIDHNCLANDTHDIIIYCRCYKCSHIRNIYRYKNILDNIPNSNIIPQIKKLVEIGMKFDTISVDEKIFSSPNWSKKPLTPEEMIFIME